MLRDLPFALTWEFYWDLPSMTRAALDEEINIRWEHWLQDLKSRDKRAYEQVICLVADLPSDGLQRFLTAPETYRRIGSTDRIGTRNNIAFVKNSLKAELMRVGMRSPDRRVLWTALGDAYFGSETSAYAPILSGAIGRQGIVVDTASPYSTLTMSSHPELATEPLVGRELEYAVQILSEAIKYIRIISEAAGKMVSSSVRVIIVRQNPSSPKCSSSSSWPNYIGKIGLINYWAAEEEGAASLTNSLVHEAIHSLLYSIECFEPFYPSRYIALRDSVVSPWSGRSLRLHSFIHACFVWYGLLCFWSRAIRSSIFSLEVASRHLRRSAKGFQDPALSNCLAAVGPHLTFGAREAIRQIQETTLQSVTLRNLLMT